MGLSKAMALAHTGICQGHGGALFVSRFRRPYSLPALLRYRLLVLISNERFATSFKALSLPSADYHPAHPDRYCAAN
jgi:hypothetical protein